ncbi:MAG: DNA polymerase III subunit delta', partial [Rhizobiaceae bacterium]|nr:DNA polymerase III subunit delta' [Rhizobiaceae bacterium]
PEPSENPVLIGHDEVRALLAAAYRAGKLPHALLLAGPAGIGKATLAFHLANHLLVHRDAATAPDTIAAPDPASPVFRQVASGAHAGVLHLTRPANEKTKGFRTAVTVDEIRKVNRFLSMTAHDGGYRVVIVDPADDMNTNAANALLKNLEEPPSRTVFILIAHSPGRLLPTIRSRCQVMRLHPLGEDELLAALGTVGVAPPQEAEARSVLAAQADGSVRQAILLAEHGGLEIARAIEDAARAPRADWPAMNKLAEVVAARDHETRFDLFNRHALDMLSDAASAAAREGSVGRAERLAKAWQQARVAVEEAETYNLDRKQHALNMISSLNAALRM